MTPFLPPREQTQNASFWVKVFAWGVVLPGVAAVCLQAGLLGPAALLAAVGLLFTLRLALAATGRRRRAPLLALCGIELVLLLSSIWLLGRPLRGGWTRLPGTASWSDPTLLLTGDTVLVVVTSSPKGSFWSEDAGHSFRSRGLPGHFGFVLADDPQRGWVWVGSAQGEHVSMFDRGAERWLQMPRPAGHVWALELSEERALLALGGAGLHEADETSHGWRAVAAVQHCTGVAAAPHDPAQLLAVGHSWWSSVDGGRRWSRVGSPLEARFHHPAVELGGGGWRYVYEGGLVRGQLAVAAPGRRFQARELPASDVRVLIAGSEDGRQLLLGTWGRGVFRSRDGGAHWENLGLQSVEVRSLVWDERHRRVFAASSNLLLRKGIYTRVLPP